ncbi:MAG TPA: DUF4097 family beta strand repeat-containing protein [Candidatus Acidoferrum sp.]|nr:DUF4097 family beta strand repeat-containing protein [Candidatus Acidoferrum sp.]
MSSVQQPPAPPAYPVVVVPPPPRPPQRKSIFAGLLLIVLGVLFLLFRFDPELHLATLIWRYWTVIIIVWGVAKLADHLMARGTGERTPILTGGEAALLVVVLFCSAGLGVVDHLRHRHDLQFNFHPFSDRYSESDALPARKIPPNAHVTIQTDRGNIMVHAGGGDELRVTVNKSASDPNRSAAEDRMADVRTVIEQTDNGFSVHPLNQQDWEGSVDADLDVQLPKTAVVTASTGHGDVNISGFSSAVQASVSNGDIDVHDAASNVSATINSGNVRISDIQGNVSLSGHGGEVDVSDVSGDANLNGEFYGPIRVRNISQTTHFSSSRSNMILTHLAGRLELDSGDVQLSNVAGAVKVATQNNDIDAEDVAGPLEIADSHGDITIRCSRQPNAAIEVTDESGEVRLTLPDNSSFQISAVSQSGDVDSEFESPSLRLVNDQNVGRLTGTVGSGGPKIVIVTSYGTISLHKGD